LYIVETLKRIDPFYGKIALTIGNFEGYHLGHVEVIRILKEEAKRNKLFPAVISFKQHPMKVIKGREPGRLWTPGDKLIQFIKEEIALFIYLDFSKEFASTSPLIFLKILQATLNPKILCLGESFRFGKDNLGEIKLVKECEKKYGYNLIPVKEVIYHGLPISSTRLRKAIKHGDFEQTNQMLGRPYSVYLIKDFRKDGVLKPFIENMALPCEGYYKGKLKEIDKKPDADVKFLIKNGFFYHDNLGFMLKDTLYKFCFTV